MTALTSFAAAIPTLDTPRLRLRAPCEADFETFAAFGASARSAGAGGPFSRLQSFQRFSALLGHWALRGFGRWIVADRASDAALGLVGPYFPDGWPEPEIAWTVFDGAEGRGIAHEAAEAARRHAYHALGWSTAISCIAHDNVRSQALARRLGCTPDGTFLHPEGVELVIWRHPGPEAVR